MADHVTQQILVALQAALTGSTDAAASVHLERLDPLARAELPAILIEPGVEDVADVLTMARPYRQARSLSVLITAVVAQTTGYGAAARQIGKQIELAIANSAPLAALSTQVPRLLGSQPDKAGDADLPMAVLTQSWRFPYHTLSNTPDAVN